MGDIKEALSFEQAGFACKVVRIQLSSRWWWCGYVRIPKGHMLHGRDLNDPQFERLNVHGGITFVGNHDDGTDDYWLGFDTAHGGDSWGVSGNWNIGKLITETRCLADQIYVIGGNGEKQN